MFNIQEVRVLGNALNTTFGKSSEPSGLTHTWQGNNLNLQISNIVHFASESSLREQVRSLGAVSNDIFSDALSRIKAEFKEGTGRALKATELSRDDNVELISASSNSPRKIAYYRCLLKLEIS